MTDSTTPLATLFERAEDYGKTTLKLIKLNSIDKSSDLISSFASVVAIIMVVVLSILIIDIGLALWIGKMLGETYYGFFVIGGFYTVLAIVLQFFREQFIKYPVRNSIIKQLLKTKQV